MTPTWVFMVLIVQPIHNFFFLEMTILGTRINEAAKKPVHMDKGRLLFLWEGNRTARTQLDKIQDNLHPKKLAFRWHKSKPIETPEMKSSTISSRTPQIGVTWIRYKLDPKKPSTL